VGPHPRRHTPQLTEILWVIRTLYVIIFAKEKTRGSKASGTALEPVREIPSCRLQDSNKFIHLPSNSATLLAIEESICTSYKLDKPRNLLR
jgi:hypothetical protein